MNQKKVDLYTLIHKAQRAHMFALSTKIGKTDFSNQQEANSIKQELESIIDHLRKHSKNESTFIHPLYVEAGDKASAIDDEHDDLEIELHKLEDILAAKQWEKLYAAFNRFISMYLAHQDEEEQAQEEILWKHFENARLAAALNAFLASRSPALAMEDHKFVMPHLSMAELSQMYKGMKASAPPAAFQAACHLAETMLEPNRWAQLEQLLT
jgi:Hemerythrin HHE cation binding domain